MFMEHYQEEAIRNHVTLCDDALIEIEEAFKKLHSRTVSQPPVIRVDIPEHRGEADIKTAYIPGLSTFAIKVSCGFFNNPSIGLPSLGGLMLAMDAKTGVPKALLADNGYLTDVRTALAGAIAADRLAKKTISTVAVFGTGMQARLQVKALKLVRNFAEVIVVGRSEEKAHLYKKEIEDELNVPVHVAKSGKEAAEQADLIVTTTPAEHYILKADWLLPGVHVTAIGSDAEHKQEIEPAAFFKADKVVCDLYSQSSTIGELHHVQDFLAEHAIELGAILTGEKEGRTSERERTICDLTGTGVQDTAIANYALAKMKRSG